MRISAKTEYACLAVVDLALAFDLDAPVRVREIAERHGIPSQFLVQILAQLKAAGIVSSTRGAAGGYRLAHEPAALSLATVMAVIEGSEGELQSSATQSTPQGELLHNTWQEICDLQREMLRNVTLADLAEKSRTHEQNMFYI